MSHVRPILEVTPPSIFHYCQISLRGKRYPVTGLDKTLRLQKIQAPRTSRQSAHEDGKGNKPQAPALITLQETSLVLISVRS